jgi:hypothetical protein
MAMIGSSWLEDDDYYGQAEEDVVSLAELILPSMKYNDIAGVTRTSDTFKKLRDVLLRYDKDIDEEYNIVPSASALADMRKRAEQVREYDVLRDKRKAESDARLAELALRPPVGVKLINTPEWNNKTD